MLGPCHAVFPEFTWCDVSVLGSGNVQCCAEIRDAVLTLSQTLFAVHSVDLVFIGACFWSNTSFAPVVGSGGDSAFAICLRVSMSTEQQQFNMCSSAPF